MLFWVLLQKFRKKKERKIIVRELIIGLNLDKAQKNLFLDSLELLDEPGLEALYKKLQTFVNSYEEKIITQTVTKRNENVKWRIQQEQKEKESERKTFNILFDNI